MFDLPCLHTGIVTKDAQVRQARIDDVDGGFHVSGRHGCELVLNNQIMEHGYFCRTVLLEVAVEWHEDGDMARSIHARDQISKRLNDVCVVVDYPGRFYIDHLAGSSERP